MVDWLDALSVSTHCTPSTPNVSLDCRLWSASPPPPHTESQAYEISLGKLNKLLEDRTKYYENADVTIDLRGYGKDEQAGAPAAGTMGLYGRGVWFGLGQGMAAGASLGLAARMWVLTMRHTQETSQLCG
jgi:hypothetical protein